MWTGGGGEVEVESEVGGEEGRRDGEGRVDRGRKLKRSEKRVTRRGVRWRGEEGGEVRLERGD